MNEECLKRVMGALYDFAGFLTTEPRFEVGSDVDAGVMAHKLEAWCKQRGIDHTTVEADVNGWNL